MRINIMDTLLVWLDIGYISVMGLPCPPSQWAGLRGAVVGAAAVVVTAGLCCGAAVVPVGALGGWVRTSPFAMEFIWFQVYMMNATLFLFLFHFILSVYIYMYYLGSTDRNIFSTPI